MRENALLLLSNIVADAIDVEAAKTRTALKLESPLESLLPLLWTESYEELLFTLGILPLMYDEGFMGNAGIAQYGVMNCIFIGIAVLALTRM